MKLIELEVLCRDAVPEETETNQSYKSVLEELNLATKDDEEEDTYWKAIYFSVKILDEELFTIEPRTDHEEDNCVVTFFDSRTVIINKSKDELGKLLDDTK